MLTEQGGSQTDGQGQAEPSRVWHHSVVRRSVSFWGFFCVEQSGEKFAFFLTDAVLEPLENDTEIKQNPLPLYQDVSYQSNG